jgi:elongation factor 1-beta
MGKVSVTFRVMPTGVDVDLERVETSVRGILGNALKSLEVRPVAFGLKAILATAILDDTGGTEALEGRLSGIENVESVETADVTLI